MKGRSPARPGAGRARRLVERRCGRLENVALFSGGNDGVEDAKTGTYTFRAPVAGKYRVTASMAGSHEAVLDVVDYLVEQER